MRRELRLQRVFLVILLAEVAVMYWQLWSIRNIIADMSAIVAETQETLQ